MSSITSDIPEGCWETPTSQVSQSGNCILYIEFRTLENQGSGIKLYILFRIFLCHLFRVPHVPRLENMHFSRFRENGNCNIGNIMCVFFSYVCNIGSVIYVLFPSHPITTEKGCCVTFGPLCDTSSPQGSAFKISFNQSHKDLSSFSFHRQQQRQGLQFVAGKKAPLKSLALISE